MASKRNAAPRADTTVTPGDDAVEAALAMIDAELNGEQLIADAVASIEENADSAPAAGGSETAMEGQPDDGDVEAALAEIESTAAAPTKKKAAKVKADKKAAEPKIVAPVRMFTDVAAIDKTLLESNLNGLNAKKVIEKAQNVIQAVETGKKLSRYTADAVRALKVRGTISAKVLVETFLAAGLTDGTARAQSQQMTALFKVLGIATPDATNARELILADAGLVDELVLLSA